MTDVLTLDTPLEAAPAKAESTAAASGSLACKNLIFVSMEDWDEVWRRNQFVCASLAQRHPDLKILFVGLGRHVWRHLRSGNIKPLLTSSSVAVPGFPNITVTRALRLAPERFNWGRWINNLLTRLHVRRAARRLGMNQAMLWLNPHYSVHMVGHMGERAVVYDITDDWSSLRQPLWLREQIKRQDVELCGKADAVIVCSPRLQVMKKNLAGSKLHLIPNGVHAEHYQAVSNSEGPLPASDIRWPRPVFGYTGTVHPERVDVDLVEKAARRLTSGTFVFIGPNLLPPEDQQRLLATGRVVLLGPAPYEKLPGLMRAFDVCIAPHRMTPFTESLNPIKLWEYLAAGKPIVSTDIAGFRDYPQFVRISRSAEGFCQALQAACSEPDLSAQRQAEAQKHSWLTRIDSIEKVINLCSRQTQSN